MGDQQHASDSITEDTNTKKNKIVTAAGKVLAPDNPTFVTTSATNPNGKPVEITDDLIAQGVKAACQHEKGRPLAEVEKIDEVPRIAHPKGKLLVVDGHSLAFRAYFAYPVESFSTKSGQATNAVYGFFMMLADTVKKEKPTHIGVAFDVKGGTFRNAVLKQYKGTRNAAPEDLLSQLPLIQKLLFALNIPYIEKPGYEGDDVVASLATLGEKQGYDVLVLSGDRDSFQLIDDNITVLYPGYHFSNLSHMTPEAVHEKYKVWPHQYPDIAALRGETSDNIPGVPGVGDGYAAKWINQFGGLDGILAHADQIGGKKGADLRSMIDQVKQNRWINAVRRHLDLNVSFDQLRITTFNQDELDSVLKQLEFGVRTRRRLVTTFSANSGQTIASSSQLSKDLADASDDATVTAVQPTVPVFDTCATSQSAAHSSASSDNYQQAQHSSHAQQTVSTMTAPFPIALPDMQVLTHWFEQHVGPLPTPTVKDSKDSHDSAHEEQHVYPTIDGTDQASIAHFLKTSTSLTSAIAHALVVLFEGDSRPGRERVTALDFLAPDGHALRLSVSALNREEQVEGQTDPDDSGQASFDLDGDDQGNDKTPSDSSAISEERADQYRHLLSQAIASAPLIVWGYKEDLRLAHAIGISVPTPVLDVRLASYIVQPDTSPVSVEACATAFMKTDYMPEKERRSRKKLTAAERKEQESSRNALLARRLPLVAALARTFAPVIDRRGQRGLLDRIEMPTSRVLAGMEDRGADVDRHRLESIRREFATAEAQAQTQAYRCAGRDDINLSSPKQLQTVLFDQMSLKGAKKTRRGYSTSASELDKLLVKYADNEQASGFLVALKDYREQSKLEGMIETLQETINPQDNRIHTTYEQTVAATGRLSSADPNLQNIPNRSAEGRQIRSAFVAAPRFTQLLSCDYSQVELRIMAHLSGDERLIEAFRSGADFHKYVASLVYGIPIDQITPAQRTHVKAMSYGLAYGLTNFGLSQRLEVSPAEASILSDKYFATFGKVHDYLESLVRLAQKRGYTETMFGRRRYFPALHTHNRMARLAAQREALNAPIQGSAADIMKLAMIRAQQELDRMGARSQILLQIHDELIVGLAAGEEEKVTALIKDAMENAVHLSVPLSVSTGVGPNWKAAAH
jgi:DNA polymerase-1